MPYINFIRKHLKLVLPMFSKNNLKMLISPFIQTRKIAALQPAFSAATVGPFKPNNRALRAHLKMFKIHLENFTRFLQNFSNGFPQNFPNGFPQKWIFNIFSWTRRALFLGPKGPTVAAEGCSPPQELEKSRPQGGHFSSVC